MKNCLYPPNNQARVLTNECAAALPNPRPFISQGDTQLQTYTMDISAMVPSIGGGNVLAITVLASFVGAEDEHITASKPIIDQKKSLREKQQQRRELGYGIPKEYIDNKWAGDAHEDNYYSSSRDAWGPSFKCVSKADKASLSVFYICVFVLPPLYYVDDL